MEPQPELAPPPTLPPPPTPRQPERALEDKDVTRVKTPGRWAPIAAVIVAGIVLMSVLAGPSGNAPDDNEVDTPTITAQTTTTVPAPGSSRDLWSPAPGSWVGGFTFVPRRPDTLFGPTMATGLFDIAPDIAVVDSLPDGRLVGIDSANERVVLIGAEDGDLPPLEAVPLPEPGPDSAPPLLSPNGSRLALVDASGVPHVWEVGRESAVSLADSASTAVQAIATFMWSPDSQVLAINAFQGGFYLWDLRTGEVSRTPFAGRAVAVSGSQVAVWGGSGLELRDHAGRVLRRWSDLYPGEPAPALAEGAFDPQQRFLAVRGKDGPDEEAIDGLSVLSLVGTTQQLLTTDPAQGFAWSGDGSALYWLDARGLQAWSADPERASAALVGGGLDRSIIRLRVYDPALLPVPPPVLETTFLLERREGAKYLRAMGELRPLDGAGDLATIVPAGVSGRVLAVAGGETDHPVVLAGHDDESQQFLGMLNALQLPDGARIVRAIALTPADADGDFTPAELEATRWYLETDSGSILHGPEAGLFTTAAEGSSLGLLGGTAFYVTPDGSAIQTIPVGVGIDTVLRAEDLEAERILAVGAIRRTLFVLAGTPDGETNLWQVPADSPLLTTPLFPPQASMTSEAWIVYNYPYPSSGGWIMTDPDTGPSGELAAVRIDGPEGRVTVAIAAPLALESVCGAGAGGACVLFTAPGEPLGFSPDGHWLLVGNGENYSAVSTVGRGIVIIPDAVPDDVAWVEKSP